MNEELTIPTPRKERVAPGHGAALTRWLGMVGVALGYFALGKIGLSLAYLNPSASPVWPPTGVALGLLLLFGRSLWPGVFAGAFFVNLTTQGSLLTSLGIATGNTLEAVLGAFLVVRFAGGKSAFDRLTSILRYVLYAGMLSTAVSATIGTASLWSGKFLDESSIRGVWETWWLGDLESNLMFAPLLVLSRRIPPPRFWNPWRAFEFVAIYVTTVTLTHLVFSRSSPFSYLCILPILWAAFRFRQAGAIHIAFLICCLALLYTLRGRGPFARMDPNTALLTVQFFIGVISLTALVVGAIVTEREAEEHRRKQAEEALRKREEYLQATFNQAAVGMALASLDGRFIETNSKLSEILGYSAAELRELTAMGITHPEDIESTRQSLQRLLNGDVNDYVLEKRYVRKDGQTVWCLTTVTLLKDRRGKPYRCIGVVEDISALRKVQTDLELANRAKDQFLAALSHELRTPLTPVMMTISSLLNRPGLPDGVADALARINRNILAEARLIDDLLDLTRIMHKKLDFEVEALDLNACIHQALEICEPDIRHADANLTLALDPSEPRVLADRKRLQQICWNLIKNAIKFNSPQGRITIRTSSRGEQVEIRFEDEGAGIGPKHLDSIFNPFEQGEHPGSGGLGLGLAICKSAVEGLGGKISAESPGRGQGSIFTVILPAADSLPHQKRDAPDDAG